MQLAFKSGVARLWNRLSLMYLYVRITSQNTYEGPFRIQFGYAQTMSKIAGSSMWRLLSPTDLLYEFDLGKVILLVSIIMCQSAT